MKTKIEKNYSYTGLGFPIQINQVEMILLGDDWHPKIDVRKVADIVIRLLATKESPFTGHEVKFIRVHFGMSLRAFADSVVHESHTAVKKWEDEKNKPTKMNPNTEFVIRHFIIEQTSTKSEKKAVIFEKTTQAKIFYHHKNKQNKVLHIDKCA